MSTRKDKRVESRGYGHVVLESQKFSEKTRLIFAEREPDNLMAAAIESVYGSQDLNKIIKFTDRHSINYDITKYCREFKCDEILILCPSINEYSVMYLDKLGIPYKYIGSSTKLSDEYLNEHIFLTTESVTRIMCRKYGLQGRIFDEIEAYTNRFFPKDMDLYKGIRYQYLCFKKSANELFQLFKLHVEQKLSELSIENEEEYLSLYEKQMIAISEQVKQARIEKKDGITFAFLHGGCPCTLLLNAAFRNLNVDVCVNYCLHRQHFTVLSENMMKEVYDKYVSQFIYSGCGKYSGGGCFEKNCTDDRFIEAFINNYSIHGFYNDRKQDYNDFNPEEYEWITSKNGLTDKYIYKNFNFTIFIDSYCNADCKFCIEQIKTKNSGIIEKQRLDEKQQYIKRLDHALGKIRELNPSVSVTGGEPLLCPYFKDVMRLLKKYQFRKTVITTNGSDILNHIDEIIDAGISHVNFSRPHFDPAIIQNIMRFKDEHFADYFEELKMAIEKLEAAGVRTRFNCIISKAGINSVESMKNYMDYVRTLGCKHVVFRELMSFNEDTAMNEEKKAFARDNRVYINNLWSQIDDDEDFRYSMNMQGHYYYIEIYEYKDMVMVSERANLKCLEDNHDKNENYIYEMVFHPNGNLCTGWIESENILDLS